jgi:hypothetical protein
MSTTKWNSCVVITVDRYFFIYCVSYVYVGSHSCADQGFFFLYSPTWTAQTVWFGAVTCIAHCHILMCSSVRMVTYWRHITSDQWPVSNALWISGTLNFTTQSRVVSVYLSMTLQLNSGQAGSLFIHSRKDSSEWVISPSQRPPRAQHTTNTWDELSCSQQVLKARSQWSSGRRPTPQIARPLESAVGSKNWYRVNLEGCFKLCVVCISVRVHSDVLYAVKNHPILALHNQCTWKNVITKSEQQLIKQKLSSSCAAPTERSASSWPFCRQKLDSDRPGCT